MTKTDDNPAFPTKLSEKGYNANGDFADIIVPGLTARQYAAIHLCVPRSGDDWLDDMIREAQRDRFAMAAMQGFLAGAGAGQSSAGLSVDVWAVAHNMMKERE